MFCQNNSLNIWLHRIYRTFSISRFIINGRLWESFWYCWQGIDLRNLKHFGFGDSIRNWIRTVYNGIYNPVSKSTGLAHSVSIYRETPSIFFCAEILATLTRNNRNIKGLNAGNIDYLLWQSAADSRSIYMVQKHDCFLSCRYFHSMPNSQA